jgi:hypothetical protein
LVIDPPALFTAEVIRQPVSRKGFEVGGQKGSRRGHQAIDAQAHPLLGTAVVIIEDRQAV